MNDFAGSLPSPGVGGTVDDLQESAARLADRGLAQAAGDAPSTTAPTAAAIRLRRRQHHRAGLPRRAPPGARPDPAQGLLMGGCSPAVDRPVVADTVGSSGVLLRLPRRYPGFRVGSAEAAGPARLAYDREVARTRLVGGWRLLDRFGGGGNGDVYRCTSADGTKAAIKILRRGRDVHRDRISRFRNEVHFLISRGNCPDVLPLLDSALPDDPGQPSWYVTPIAVPLIKALGVRPQLLSVVSTVEQIAQTLARLAADGISHRDIKPDNLFLLNDVWAIGDFGLVKYPEQEAITRHGRPRAALLHGTRDASRRGSGGRPTG